MVNELLGPHVQIVDDLLKQLRDIQNGDTASPRVVVLEGPSGVGKTRIIQELYQKLRENDPYWPPMQEPVRVETAGADPMAARKLVAPNPKDFTWPAGALPSFGWWGLNCERLSRGSYLDAVAELRPQLDAHTVPLMLALEERRSSWEKLAAFAAPLKKTLRELRTTYSEEGTTQAIDGVLELLIEGATGASVSLDLVAPGLATLVKLGWRGLKASNERALNQDDLRMTIDQGERVRRQHQSRSVELAQALANFTHSGFPVVVAVEDIHLMGDDFSKFLSTLVARKERRIMVVATTWPERNAEDPFSQWLEDAEEADTAVRIAVPNLDEEDLVLLVKSHAPNTTDNVARAVATQLPNPHYVKLWLTVPSIQRQIQLHGDAVVLGDSGLTVPHDIHEILRLRWRSLESHIQQALCLAVAINPIEDPLCSFVPGVLEDLAASSNFLNSKEISEGAVRAVDPALWCRLSEGVEAFTEALLAERCRDEIGQQFATEEVEEFIAQLRGITSRHIKNEAGDGISMPLVPRALNLALWQRRLPAENRSTEDVIVLSTLALFAQQQYDYTTAIAHITDAINAAEQLPEFDPLHLLELRGLHAMFLGDSGRPAEAADVLERLLSVDSEVLGQDNPTRLMLRGNLALMLARSGKIEDGIKRYETLYKDCMRIVGDEARETLIARGNLASLRGESGCNQEAVDELDRLLDDATRIFGVNDPITLNTRSSLAFQLGKVGRLEKALEQFRNLLIDQTRLLGAEHPGTLDTRNNIAFVLFELGRVRDAVNEYKALLDDRSRILGTVHPSTLNTQGNLAFALGSAGQIGQAIEQFKMLRKRITRVLEPDHPDTLRACRNLAGWLSEDGQVDKAIEQLTVLRKRITRVLGADHPDTLATRAALLTVMRRAHRYDEAMTMLTPLLADQLRVLGPDNPLTLRTRSTRASLRGDLGQINDAIVEFESLYDDQVRVFGKDHPDVLRTRGNLADLIGCSGQAKKAYEMYQPLLADCARILGPDHPNTLIARNNCASWLIDAGDDQAALVELTELLKDCGRALPSNDDLTRAVRNQLQRIEARRRIGLLIQAALKRIHRHSDKTSH